MAPVVAVRTSEVETNGAFPPARVSTGLFAFCPFSLEGVPALLLVPAQSRLQAILIDAGH